MKRIGILGGTFDPPHNGHLQIAKTAKKCLSLDLILFIPCSRHILKKTKPHVSDFHRSNMVSLLCTNDDTFIIENCELEKGGISFTSDTLAFLKKKYKNSKFLLLMGKDSYDSLDLWKSPEKIRDLARIVVIPRGKEEIVLKDKRDMDIKTKKINVSSTQIRNNLLKGISVERFVPKAVLRYIKKEKLYIRKES